MDHKATEQRQESLIPLQFGIAFILFFTGDPSFSNPDVLDNLSHLVRLYCMGSISPMVETPMQKLKSPLPF